MTDEEIREYLKSKPLDYKLQEIGNELLRARNLLRELRELNPFARIPNSDTQA